MVTCDPALLAILGPTASGKSALGLFLAQNLKGEIVACDSTQVYRGFDIGTAKPTWPERQAVPHHLLDVVSPAEIFSAGEYRRRVGIVLQEIWDRSHLPILTVGTGLYLRALLEGLAGAPQRSEELRHRLRCRAQAKGGAYLHRLLTRLDPAAASRIAPQDAQKLIRAAEVCLLTGTPISAVHRAGRAPLRGVTVTKIGLLPPRTELYARIDNRVRQMIAEGWIEEVKAMLSSGVPREAKPFDFIGYRQLRDVLEGRIGLAAAVSAIQQATRNYAKRQLTWFRKEAGVHWFAGFGDSPPVQSAILNYVKPR